MKIIGDEDSKDGDEEAENAVTSTEDEMYRMDRENNNIVDDTDITGGNMDEEFSERDYSRDEEVRRR